MPDEFPARALTKHKVHRINNDGFSCTRFAGKHIEAGMKCNIKLLDQSNVFDKESLQHFFVFIV